MAAKNEGQGTLETKLLFEEMDGIWLHLQGASRKQYGRSKEMKVAIAYDGTEKTGKKRYRLTNKIATANFESAKRFRLRKSLFNISAWMDGCVRISLAGAKSAGNTCCINEHFCTGWRNSGVTSRRVRDIKHA